MITMPGVHFRFFVALILFDTSYLCRTCFGSNLIGAACGTIAASVILIPYAGIEWTAAALVCLKITSLVIVRIKL